MTQLPSSAEIAAPHESSVEPPRASPLRALQLATRLNVGGVSRHVLSTAEVLETRGWHCWVAHGQLAPGEASLVGHDSRAVRLVAVPSLTRGVHPWRDLAALFSIVRLLRRLRPEVLHTHMSKAGAVGRVAAAIHNALLPRTGRCAVVHTFHGHVLDHYFGAAGSRAVRMVERLLAPCATRLIVLSQLQRETLARRHRVAPPDRLVVVPLGIEQPQPSALSPQECRWRFGIPEGAIVFGFVGRLVAVKNPLLLLKAFERVAAIIPTAVLVFAGDGDLRAEAESAAARYGLAPRVRFAGWVREPADLYPALDILVSSSLDEGTPVAVLEAMAAGRPVIATRVGGVPDVIVHGETGLLVPSGDAGALAAAMIELAGSPSACHRLGAAGRERLNRSYSAIRTAEMLEAVYREAISNVRSGGSSAAASAATEGAVR